MTRKEAGKLCSRYPARSLRKWLQSCHRLAVNGYHDTFSLRNPSKESTCVVSEFP
jgi:hypothetical protein